MKNASQSLTGRSLPVSVKKVTMAGIKDPRRLGYASPSVHGNKNGMCCDYICSYAHFYYESMNHQFIYLFYFIFIEYIYIYMLFVNI